MTTLAPSASGVAVGGGADALRTLAALEARRYARHPLFLTGVAL